MHVRAYPGLDVESRHVKHRRKVQLFAERGVPRHCHSIRSVATRRVRSTSTWSVSAAVDRIGRIAPKEGRKCPQRLLLEPRSRRLRGLRDQTIASKRYLRLPYPASAGAGV